MHTNVNVSLRVLNKINIWQVIINMRPPILEKPRAQNTKKKKLTSVLNTVLRQNPMGPIRHAANDLDFAPPLDPRRTLASFALDIGRSLVAMPVLCVPAPNVTPMLVVRVAYSLLVSVENDLNRGIGMNDVRGAASLGASEADSCGKASQSTFLEGEQNVSQHSITLQDNELTPHHGTEENIPWAISEGCLM